MSGLYTLRSQIRDLLLQDGLWNKDEVIIKRRTDVWNTVATAMAVEGASGQCLVIGTAKGVAAAGQRDRGMILKTTVSIAVTMIELPRVDDAEDPEEDTRWELTVARLLGSSLGRSVANFQLVFDGFEDVEDKEYVIRQTIFKTDLIIRKPQPSSP